MITRNTRILAVAVAAAWCGGLALTSAAMASPKDHCTSVGQHHWKPISEVENQLRDMGYEVRKVEVEGTCYEVKAEKDGAVLKLLYDPATALLETARQK